MIFTDTVVMHRPVYQRHGRPDGPKPLQEHMADQMSYSPAYADFVWRLLKQCAEGANPPVVDQSGWDAA